MALIEITIAEIVDILVAKSYIPYYISKIGFEGNRLSFEVKKGLKFRVALEFREFEGGALKFEIIMNVLLRRFLKKLIRLNEKYILMEFPIISILVQKVIEDNFIVTRIENIHFHDGKITIKTINMS